jgi:alkylation response protein AidB-like acyl-CoA dehydrogenase
LDFAFTPEQTAVRDSTLDFARERLNAGGPPGDDEAFPREKWAECAGFGLLGLVAPSEYGGSGYDALTAAIALEALGAGCEDHGLVHAVTTQIICSIQLSLFGSPQQKEEYLPSLCRGSSIAAQAMTEPDAGSDFAAIQTRAVREVDAYVLTGRKTFITNGPIADVALVFAVTNPRGGALAGLSCLIVDATLAGFERSKPMRKMGLGTLQNGDLVFDGCRVPVEKRLGQEGNAGILFGEAMEWERILLFATQVGKLARLLEATVRYGKTRHQFGQPIGRFQSISNKVADMRVSLELGRLIIYRGAWLKAHGRRATVEASIAKLFVSESCKAACLDAVQVHGGFGYMKEAGLERELRDSVGATIYSGTSEIQRNIIARLSGL